MTILNRFYVAGGDDVQLVTLQLDVAGDAAQGIEAKRWFFVEGYEDVEARLETGEVVLFQQFAMQVALPARNADGVQDMKFALCNVDGVVSTEIQLALASRLKMHATLRTFFASDMSAPSQRPFRFEVKNGQWSPVQVDITAGYRKIMDTGWPRMLYTLEKYPGLRYIA